MSALMLAGCGGGGGGGGSTPTTTATFSVEWPARSRATTANAVAPTSALSAVVTVTPVGGSGGSSFSVNRDPAQLGDHVETYSHSVNASPGTYTVTIQFHTQADGAGGIVGTATSTVTVSGDSTALGSFIVIGTVATVAVNTGQSVAVGQAADLAYTVKDGNGNVVANVSPGSAIYAETDGKGYLSINSLGQLVGATNGLAQVTVTVDGKTSAPVSVGVGTAAVPVTTSGTRGSVAISDTSTDLATGATATTVGPAGGTSVLSFLSGWFLQNTVTAPSAYGDRKFVDWTRGGQTVSSSPSFVFTPADANGTAQLTAVYQPLQMPNATNPDPTTHFSPNYNQGTATGVANEAGWDPAKIQSGLKIYIDPAMGASVIQRIRKGFDRWVSATGSVISYAVVGTPTGADMTVEFGNQEASPAEQGLTSVTFGGNVGGPVYATHADISILSTAPGQAPVGPNNIDPLEVLAAHEFGHALGLVSGAASGATAGGHSSDPNDTMYAGLNVSTTNSITARDMNSLENLYPTLF